jgi:hypothetical protein
VDRGHKPPREPELRRGWPLPSRPSLACSLRARCVLQPRGQMEVAAAGPPPLVAAAKECRLFGEKNECPCGAKVVAEAIDVAKVIAAAAYVKESRDAPLVKGEICDSLRGVAFVRTGHVMNNSKAGAVFEELFPKSRGITWKNSGRLASTKDVGLRIITTADANGRSEQFVKFRIPASTDDDPTGVRSKLFSIISSKLADGTQESAWTAHSILALSKWNELVSQGKSLVLPAQPKAEKPADVGAGLQLRHASADATAAGLPMLGAAVPWTGVARAAGEPPAGAHVHTCLFPSRGPNPAATPAAPAAPATLVDLLHNTPVRCAVRHAIALNCV